MEDSIQATVSPTSNAGTESQASFFVGLTVGVLTGCMLLHLCSKVKLSHKGSEFGEGEELEDIHVEKSTSQEPRNGLRLDINKTTRTSIVSSEQRSSKTIPLPSRGQDAQQPYRSKYTSSEYQDLSISNAAQYTALTSSANEVRVNLPQRDQKTSAVQQQDKSSPNIVGRVSTSAKFGSSFSTKKSNQRKGKSKEPDILDLFRRQNNSAYFEEFSPSNHQHSSRQSAPRSSDLETGIGANPVQDSLSLASNFNVSESTRGIDLLNVDPVLSAVNSILSKDNSFQIDAQELVLGRVIGSGSSGCIFAARYCGSQVAVKEVYMHLRGINSNERVAKLGKDNFMREFTSLRRLRHPHVLTLFGATVLQSDYLPNPRFLLVMERAKCSLRDLLDNPRFVLSEVGAIRMAIESAAGCAYIHSKETVHFDIKPANLLLVGNSIKVADLGISRLRETGATANANSSTVTMARGTPHYMAPELLLFEGADIGYPVDVYSWSLVFWEMLHRRNPFPRWPVYVLFFEVLHQGLRPEIGPLTQARLRDLMYRCWHPDPATRPTFEYVLTQLNYALREIQTPSQVFLPGAAVWMWKTDDAIEVYNEESDYVDVSHFNEISDTAQHNLATSNLSVQTQDVVEPTPATSNISVPTQGEVQHNLATSNLSVQTQDEVEPTPATSNLSVQTQDEVEPTSATSNHSPQNCDGVEQIATDKLMPTQFAANHTTTVSDSAAATKELISNSSNEYDTQVKHAKVGESPKPRSETGAKGDTIGPNSQSTSKPSCFEVDGDGFMSDSQSKQIEHEKQKQQDSRDLQVQVVVPSNGTNGNNCNENLLVATNGTQSNTHESGSLQSSLPSSQSSAEKSTTEESYNQTTPSTEYPSASNPFFDYKALRSRLQRAGYHDNIESEYERVKRLPPGKFCQGVVVGQIDPVERSALVQLGTSVFKVDMWNIFTVDAPTPADESDSQGGGTLDSEFGVSQNGTSTNPSSGERSAESTVSSCNSDQRSSALLESMAIANNQANDFENGQKVLSKGKENSHLKVPDGSSNDSQNGGRPSSIRSIDGIQFVAEKQDRFKEENTGEVNDSLLKINGIRLNSSGVAVSGFNSSHTKSSSSDSISAQDTVVLEMIGVGTAGNVHKAVVLSSLEVVAVKSIPLKDESFRHKLYQELLLQNGRFSDISRMKVDSLSQSRARQGLTNLMEVRALFYYPQEVQVRAIFQYMSIGSCEDIIQKGGCQNENALCSILRQVAQGLDCLHTFFRGVHGDIEPRNILINHHGLVKLSGFGIAKALQNASVQRSEIGLSHFESLLQYFAAERVCGKSYSYAADIWSLGASIAACGLVKKWTPMALLSNPVEYEQLLLNQTFQVVDRSAATTLYSKQFCDVLYNCTEFNPSSRPTVANLLDLDFFSSVEQIETQDAALQECIQKFRTQTSEANVAEICDAIVEQISKGIQDTSQSGDLPSVKVHYTDSQLNGMAEQLGVPSSQIKLSLSSSAVQAIGER